ncbi:MAG TPA: ABC transporter ATP-binding protein [Saprospiraceae bacterium]|nr:ABC transporter ATP-binding protein [Saprospiraceae bacterium]HMQ83878.1 ABC transporter ATP-binding protein [Saprospiraceae bacterium]
MKLSIQNLSKTYPNGVKALDQLHLEIGSGMFGLLGPNGAGKSTLIRTIATLQKADEGSIFFNDIDALREKMALRKVLGYLPQDFGVYPKDSALALLHFFAVLKGIRSKKERESRVQYVLELTNLWQHRSHRVSTYSGGMKQRFGIAQLLLNDPQLIVVDEPTAGLDPAERTRFLNILRGLGSNRTVIFSTHLVEDVKDLCYQMAILSRGKLMALTAPSTAISSLNGRIWEVAESDFQTHDSLIALSDHYNAFNQKMIRVFAESQPAAAFAPVAPKLEDFYFLNLNA